MTFSGFYAFQGTGPIKVAKVLAFCKNCHRVELLQLNNDLGLKKFN